MIAVLGSCLALATFVTVTAMASMVVAVLWHVATPPVDRSPSRSTAGALFLLRIIPSAAAAIAVAAVFAPAFYVFEPRGTGETAGPWLMTFAAAGGLLIARGVVRACRAWSSTRRLVGRWQETASDVALPGVDIPVRSIQTPFPVVSVVGVLRPRLFIAERVLRECTGEELAAVVRHEHGHVVAGDNLKRVVLRLCPDLLSLLPFGRAIERSWHDASEDAADDYTVRGRVSPLVLADALLRVARMGIGAPPPMLPTASLYRGESVERRVRRLLAMDVDRGQECGLGSPATADRGARWIVAVRTAAAAPILAAAAVLLTPDLLHRVHHVIEAVVETLA